MKIWAKCLVLASVAMLALRTEADTVHPCDTPGFLEAPAYKNYNTLWCAGIEHMRKERFKDAITSFQSALSMRFLDIPNFQLFPQLALAYFGAGEIENAKRSLLAAELSLSILIGTLKCVEVDIEEFGVSGFVTDRYGNRVTGDVLEDVATRMCGDAYDYYYEDRSFAVTLDNAKLIERHLAAKRLIEGHAQSPE